MPCDHFGEGDPRNSWDLPGPFFEAGYPGECSRGGERFEEGEMIRADGDGGYECHECVARDDQEPLEGDGFNPFDL